MKIQKVEQGNFPWFKYEDMEFQIGYVDNEEIGIIEKNSTEITFDKKHQKEKEVNPIKFGKKIAKKAIVSWRKFKRKNFVDLIEPNKEITLGDGESWNDEIPYDADTKEFIIENMHSNFAMFVVVSAREVEAFTEAFKKKELENLEVGSVGVNPPED
jgi:hypothetical protein